MKIYTKTGDKGQTSLLGGKRAQKDCIEIVAIGEVDELNASMGVLIAQLGEKHKLHDVLTSIQHTLFVIGGELAAVQTDVVDVPRITEENISFLEVTIDELQNELPQIMQFILPGGCDVATQAFLTRAVCRRAERAVFEVSCLYNDLSEHVVAYLNRLSDLLFVVGRFLNKESGIDEVVWKK